MAENVSPPQENTNEIGEYEKNTKNLVNCSENLLSLNMSRAPVYYNMKVEVEEE